jgi:hypothetical protein
LYAEYVHLVHMNERVDSCRLTMCTYVWGAGSCSLHTYTYVQYEEQVAVDWIGAPEF